MQDNFYDAGYVCGVICSDGSITWNVKYGNYRIQLEAKDKRFVENFCKKLSPSLFFKAGIGLNVLKEKLNIFFILM